MPPVPMNLCLQRLASLGALSDAHSPGPGDWGTSSGLGAVRLSPYESLVHGTQGPPSTHAKSSQAHPVERTSAFYASYVGDNKGLSSQ